MLDLLMNKIELLDNKEKIIELAEVLNKIIEDSDLALNDKLLVVDLLNAMVNEKMYKNKNTLED